MSSDLIWSDLAQVKPRDRGRKKSSIEMESSIIPNENNNT